MCTVFTRAGRWPNGLPFGRPIWLGALTVGVVLQGNVMGFAQKAKAQMRPASSASSQAPAATAAGAARNLSPAQQEWTKQSAQLLLLATQLKHEVDKTTENILSVKVIEKAREIEQFTHATEQQLKAQN